MVKRLRLFENDEEDQSGTDTMEEESKKLIAKKKKIE